MTLELKQRLLGAGVIIALAVIFLPMLFDGAPQQIVSEDLVFNVPAEPAVPVVADQKPLAPEETSKLPGGDLARLQNLDDAPPAQKSAPKLPDIPKKAKAWNVQMGSFANEQNAKNLQKKLLDNGYHAYTKIYDTSKGKRHRVFVGPEAKKQAAIETQQKLEQKLALKGVVIQFKQEV